MQLMDDGELSVEANSRASREEEKDLNLDISDNEEDHDDPIPIQGSPYFKSPEPIDINIGDVLKTMIRENFGVENTEKGIDYLKQNQELLYDESKRDSFIFDFKKK